MKLKIFTLCVLSCAAFIASAYDATNKVLMVDQRGNLNTAGIASVQDVATNAVKAQIAEAKADAAQQTAAGVTAAIQGVVGNIMSNNVVIYRSGYLDSFAALITFTASDWMKIIKFTPVSTTAASIVCDISYVITTDIGAVKPLVYASNTCTNRANFDLVADANVTSPVWTAEQNTYDEVQFSGYYTIRVTIPNPNSTASYFYWIEMDGDAPMGDGATLDLPNGVSGGLTTEVTFGDKVITFYGGLARSARDAD